ncbi:MAG: Gfo/Idh/MocA family oxidoreductase [Elusimicrobia bacterium]|nr:Gfo/Idh/MocA family oxidoreductase [Elusimicrobiota bacterium]
MKTVRIGVIGVGVMGSAHAKNIKGLKRMELTAVCDADKEMADKLSKELNCKVYYDSKKLIRSGDVDAVIIATPHYDHTITGIDALEQGLHVLVEKPISSHKADCERLIAAHKNKKQIFAAMFQFRTFPRFKKIKSIIENGELGEIIRTNWIKTNWFRPEAYYSSGSWRATWKGEGGGILLNQCPHNLDLFQYICGMPKKVVGFCGLGKRHNIEVEDEVTAYLEYPNGATGVFITSTGEAPGTDRFEICGEMGNLICENDEIIFLRNEMSSSKFNKTTKFKFQGPDFWNIKIPVTGTAGMHAEIIQNFVNAILDGTPLIAPAEEGIKSVELANSILYSSITGKPVELPLNSAAYEKMLKKLIDSSKYVKVVKKSEVEEDVSKSFHK